MNTPTKAFLTQLLDDLVVQGKLNQDAMIIGRGISEQLIFKIGYAEEGTVTYDLSGCGYASVNSRFYRRTDLDSTLAAGCDSFFGEKEIDRPMFALFHNSNTNCWCLEEFSGSNAGYVTPMYQTNEDTLDENSTWKYNMGPSPAPTGVVKNETPGKQPPAIRLTPGVEGERTFTILGTMDHPVFDETITLYPYAKPINDFTNSWVLAEEDVIWISDPFEDPDFPGTRYIMYIGGANGPMPNIWRIHTMGSSDNGIYGVNWDGTNTPDFLGAQENVTWNNGEASAYPTSVDDWSTGGYQGVRPLTFSMSNTEGSPQKLEYTDDGVTWNEFGSGEVSAAIPEFEVIEFTANDLDSEGKLHIEHNFGSPNVLCLSFTYVPKNIEYQINELILDYSDRAGTSAFAGGDDFEEGDMIPPAVWFIGSKASMKTKPATGPVLSVTDCGIAAYNGDYQLLDASATEHARVWKHPSESVYIYYTSAGYWVFGSTETPPPDPGGSLAYCPQSYIIDPYMPVGQGSYEWNGMMTGFGGSTSVVLKN